MVDIVVNHMGPAGSSLNYTNYKSLKPFNSPKYYHQPCLTDDANSTSVVVCRVHDKYVSLPDLKTEDDYIRGALQVWIEDLVNRYGIDGIRIDTVKHVEKSFFPEFIQASGVFGLAEIFDGDPASYSDWGSYVPGAFSYPVSVSTQLPFNWLNLDYSTPSLLTIVTVTIGCFALFRPRPHGWMNL